MIQLWITYCKQLLLMFVLVILDNLLVKIQVKCDCCPGPCNINVLLCYN